MARRVDDPTRYARVRNAAMRQGLRLVSSRRRDPNALDFGRFWLVPVAVVVTPTLHNELDARQSMTLEEVESYLSRGGTP
jgi:hypothetical protein